MVTGRVVSLLVAGVAAVIGGLGIAGCGSSAATVTSRVATETSRTATHTSSTPVRQTGSGDFSSGPAATVLARDGWRVLARSPIGAPPGASVVWDGRMLLEIGGDSPGGTPGVLRTAAAFDPATNRWRTIAAVPSAVLPDGAVAVWTGTKLFIFGGSQPPGPPPTGIAGLYDPSSNTWTLTPPAPVTLPTDDVAAVWSAGRVILASLHTRNGQATLQVAEYDPAANSWSAMPLSVPAGHGPMAIEMVTTDSGVLLWSLWSRSHSIADNGSRIDSGVDVFRLIGGAWRNVTDNWPQNRTVDQPLFTGSQVLLGANQVWCGTCSHPPPLNANGWIVDPTTLATNALPHGPLDDLQPQILWSGKSEIALNTGGEITGPHVRLVPGDIAFLDTATGHWYEGPRAPRALGQLPAVWDGSHLLVLDQQGNVLSYGP